MQSLLIFYLQTALLQVFEGAITKHQCVPYSQHPISYTATITLQAIVHIVNALCIQQCNLNLFYFINCPVHYLFIPSTYFTQFTLLQFKYNSILTVADPIQFRLTERTHCTLYSTAPLFSITYSFIHSFIIKEFRQSIMTTFAIIPVIFVFAITFSTTLTMFLTALLFLAFTSSSAFVTTTIFTS